MAGRIARGDVRLYQFASPNKKRPVVVLTRNSAVPYLSTVTIAPVTSTIRGVPSEVLLKEDDGMKTPCAVNLHNAVTVSQDRPVLIDRFLEDAIEVDVDALCDGEEVLISGIMDQAHALINERLAGLAR